MGPWKQAFFIQHDLSIHPKCRQYESRYYECRYYKWDPISHFDPTKKLSYSLTAYYHRFKLVILLLVFFAMGIPLGIPYCIIEINEDWVRIEKKIIPKAMGHKFCCIQRLPNNLTDNLWSEPGFALTVAFNDKMTKQGELKKIDFIPVVDESPGAGLKCISVSQPWIWLSDVPCGNEILLRTSAIKMWWNCCCQLHYFLQWPFKE